MENYVQNILKHSDLSVVTKKHVRQKYKQHVGRELSSEEKEKINCLVLDFVKNLAVEQKKSIEEKTQEIPKPNTEEVSPGNKENVDNKPRRVILKGKKAAEGNMGQSSTNEDKTAVKNSNKTTPRVNRVHTTNSMKMSDVVKSVLDSGDDSSSSVSSLTGSDLEVDEDLDRKIALDKLREARDKKISMSAEKKKSRKLVKGEKAKRNLWNCEEKSSGNEDSPERISEQDLPARDSLQERLNKEGGSKKVGKKLRKIKDIEESDSDSGPMVVKKTSTKYKRKVTNLMKKKTDRNLSKTKEKELMVSSGDSEPESDTKRKDVSDKKLNKLKKKRKSEISLNQKTKAISETDSEDETLSTIAARGKRQKDESQCVVKKTEEIHSDTGNTPLGNKKSMISKNAGKHSDSELNMGNKPHTKKITKSKNKTEEVISITDSSGIEGENNREKVKSSYKSDIEKADLNSSGTLPSLDDSYSISGCSPIAQMKKKGLCLDEHDFGGSSSCSTPITNKRTDSVYDDDKTLVSETDSPIIHVKPTSKKSFGFESDSSLEDTPGKNRSGLKEDKDVKGSSKKANTIGSRGNKMSNKRKRLSSGKLNQNEPKRRKISNTSKRKVEIESESSTDDEIPLSRTKVKQKNKVVKSDEDEIVRTGNNSSLVKKSKLSAKTIQGRKPSLEQDSDSNTSPKDSPVVKETVKGRVSNDIKSNESIFRKGKVKSDQMNKSISKLEEDSKNDELIIISEDTCEEEKVVSNGNSKPDSNDESPVKKVHKPKGKGASAIVSSDSSGTEEEPFANDNKDVDPDLDCDSELDVPLASLKPEEDDDSKKGKAKKKVDTSQDIKKLGLLKKICRKSRIVLHKDKFNGCKTLKDKINKCKTLLTAAGMEGRPTMKKAEEMLLRIEAEELNADNIISSETGRVMRKVKSIYARRQISSVKSRTPMKNPFKGLSDIVDSEVSD
ncbi:titin homolog isoform X2 [Mya arenaria]|uniref:titin homolog isoform X2 n=1 Tax=Mya arenaria TaxID=6604 RepID=UPI0022E914AD|nr:titin homolog isoform X2 [Mya arenaria]